MNELTPTTLPIQCVMEPSTLHAHTTSQFVLITSKIEKTLLSLVEQTSRHSMDIPTLLSPIGNTSQMQRKSTHQKTISCLMYPHNRDMQLCYQPLAKHYSCLIMHQKKDRMELATIEVHTEEDAGFIQGRI